jgi:tetratricopeptide (TPR) repeat protein
VLVESLASALADADRAIQIVQGRPDATACSSQLDIARAQFAIGRSADALASLDAASRDPRCVEALVLRGLAQLRAGEVDQASSAFRTAWQRDPASAPLAYWLIHSNPAVIETPDGQRAMEVLRAAYAALLARADAPPGRRLATLDVPSRLGDGTPVVLPAEYVKGYALLLAGQRDRALTELRRAAAGDPLMSDRARSIPEVVAGIAALRQGHLSQARDRFKLAVARDPESSEGHRLLATSYWLEHDLERAVQELKVTVSLRPNDERSRLMLARVFDEMGALEDAETVLLDTLKRLPQSGLTQLWLAVISQKLNRDADMAQLYATIAKGTPLDGQSRLFAMAGNLYQNSGEPDAAFTAFVQSVRADPNAPDLHAELARGHLEYERRDAAFVEYVATLLVDPVNPNAYLGIGQLALNAGRHADAVTALERLVALQPGYAAARHMLGNALMRVGRTEDGARHLAEFQRLEAAAADQRRRTMAAGVLREEALVRTAEGDVPRAVALWEQLIQLEPAVAAHHAALGAVLQDAGQSDAALAHLERAASLGAAPDVYRRLAIVYNALGRPDAGVAARVRYESAVLAPARAEPAR